MTPSATMTHSLSHRLTDPDLFLYKKSYKPRVIGNHKAHDGVIRSSEWHGKQLKLSLLEKWNLELDVEAYIFSSFLVR